MRCSNPSCGIVGHGKVCTKCHSEMIVEVVADSVVICGGKLEDGSPCGSEIKSQQKFCVACGTPVDQQLFFIVKEMCWNCCTPLIPGSLFCHECGKKKKTATTGSVTDKASPIIHVHELGQRGHALCQASQLETEGNSEASMVIVSESLPEPIPSSQHQENISQQTVSEKGDCKNALKQATSEYMPNNGQELGASLSAGEKHVDIKCEGSVVKDQAKAVMEPSDATTHMNDEKSDYNSFEFMDEEGNSSLNAETKDSDNYASAGNSMEIIQPDRGNLVIYTAEDNKLLTEKLDLCHIDNVSENEGPLKIHGLDTKDLNVDDKGNHEENMIVESNKLEATGLESQTNNDTVENCQTKRKLETLENDNKRMKEKHGGEKPDAECSDDSSTVEHVNPSSQLNLTNSQDIGDQRTESTDFSTYTTSGDKFVFGEHSYGISETQDHVSMVTPTQSSLFLTEKSNTLTETPPNGSIIHVECQDDLQSCKDEVRTEGDVDIAVGDKTQPNNTDINENNGTLEQADHIVNVDDRRQTRSQTKNLNNKSNEDKKEKQNTSKDRSNAPKDGRTSKEASKPSNKNSREATILVKFHVLTSEDFKFDPKSHDLVLVLGTKEMGGWKKRDRVLSVQRPVKGSIYEMFYEEIIPQRCIYNGSCIPYKYVIIKQDEGEKELWELYIRNGLSGEGIDRILTINHNKFKPVPDVWHQFDGFIEKEPASIKEKLFDMFTWKNYKLVHHAEQAILHLLPSLCGEGVITAQETVNKLIMLLDCFRRVYYNDARCWNDYKDFTKFINVTMSLALADKLVADKNPDFGTNVDHEKRIATAFTVLYAMKEFNTPVSDAKFQLMLCKVLKVSTDTERKCCPELDLADKLFPGKRQDLLDPILTLVKSLAENTKEPIWLLLMPWIHFLGGECVPFEEPPVNVSHADKIPTWWGVKTIQHEFNSFKANPRKWTECVELILNQLVPLFEMDYLLPRTFIATLDLKDLNAVLSTGFIPIEVCLANLTYHLIVTRPRPRILDSSNQHLFLCESSEEKTVSQCISTVLQKLEVSDKTNCKITQWTMAVSIAMDMFKESLLTNRAYTFCSCVQVLIQCLSIYEKCRSDGQPDVQGFNMTSVFRHAVHNTLQWMTQYCCNFQINLNLMLQVWNDIFPQTKLQSEQIETEWNRNISDNLLSALQNNVCRDVGLMTYFVQVYCQKVEIFHPVMQDVLSKAAFLAIKDGYTVDYKKLSKSENERFGRLLSNLFVEEWKKHVHQDSKDADRAILQHILTWAPFSQYPTIYYKDQYKINLLTEECIQNLLHAVSVVEKRVDALLTGHIVVDEFYLIKEKGGKFPELVELLQLKKEFTKDFITRAIFVRQKELSNFLEQIKQMRDLTSLCQPLINVDVGLIDNILRKTEHIERHEMKEFFEPIAVEKVKDVDNFKPNSCAFKVSKAVQMMLPELQKASQSTVFYKMWTAQCQQICMQCTTLDDVFQRVWLPTKLRWDKLSQAIKSGTVKFREFEQVLGQQFKDDYDKLQSEMRTLGLSDADIKTRIDQLQKYRQLEQSVSGATVILKFKDQFRLTGDFNQIERIASHGENDMEMGSFSDSMMKICNELMDLTPVKADCLDMFVKCKPLIKWLRDSMSQSGLKELKVFVDLAFMSAGDEPMNIARVQCLHSAVTGYAPLIFDLPTNAGYKALLRACSLVWKELEANPNLPQQLKDTTQKLEWLQEVKKAHGSVEVTSLMQAEAINEFGIYTVGKNAWKKDLASLAHGHMALVECVKLTVPEQGLEGCQQQRQYTYTQLQDLQSRLMLVAGKAEKGNDAVNRFTMIFDGVIRLSGVLVKLCSSGCVLFKDWTARFMCNPNPAKPVCAILEFGQREDVPKLKGRRSKLEDLEDIIPALANFMEQCHVDWLGHIKEKRKKYIHLNYFTIDQLVILQRELVKIGPETGSSHLIYPLLSTVKENCTPDDLVQAMEEAKQVIYSSEHMEVSEIDTLADVQQEMIVEKTDDAKREEFVQAVLDAGFSRKLAVLALEHTGSDDVDEGIVWCMEHEEMDQTGPDLSQSVQETPSNVDDTYRLPMFSGWSHSEISIQSLITSNIQELNKQSAVGVQPLIDDLKTLWKQFLESISSNVKDYLSLEHLGLILKCLALKDMTTINRTLPPGFSDDQPNLIVCPSADVLSTTLSIYFMDNCKEQPLPCSKEVLMCCGNTTKDEVDIFWRRAIFDEGRKIHCLVHADLLDFEVSDAAARCLEEYLREINYSDHKYRLVIICGSDNEYRSTIVASLDKYKRQPLPIKLEALKEYLHSKLSAVPNARNKLRPAADVDNERLTVRVIKSWRAGVGKTLFKKRREEAVAILNRQAGITATSVSIPLQEKHIDLHYVTQRLLEHTTFPGQLAARLFHIDISHEVQFDVDYLLFNLLILGCLMDSTGYVWRKSPLDLYLIETMPLMIQSVNRRGTELSYVHQMLQILPDLTCRSPQESIEIYAGSKPGDYKPFDQLFDEQQCRSPVFQRTFQYLLRLDHGRDLGDVQPFNTEETPQLCLQTLLRHCGVQNPSWAELHHFVWFLNTQLVDFEQNNFVSAAAAEDLPGFSKFVLRFLIQMSRDFSTRSLNMSEESPGLQHYVDHIMEVEPADEDDENDLQAYQMRRTWETSPHPYLFSNSDRFTFTFLGFFIERATGNLIDQQTSAVLEQAIMTQNLYDALVRNHAPMQENFDVLPRDQKILKLCKVMGIDMPHDPDDTYELTTDNVKKIMAIYMRFRCDIPVIIMGETGCGKTRLVKFMCALQSPPGLDVQNMILMKVHGGTTNKDIIAKVQLAEKTAQENMQNYGQHMYTVLFFDEANTTESIGLIKEIMCDKSMEGQKLSLCANLKIVAACNPYRKHSEELIKKLEQAGLGYHVDAEETTDRLGRVPMRRLVYRVQPLPRSLLPLVWDFGQLNIQVEDLYIRQMVRRYIRNDKLPDIPGLIEVVSAVLTASQEYMRQEKDECSFVSLRDVDRVLYVMSWFYEKNTRNKTLFTQMDAMLSHDNEMTASYSEDSDDEEIGDEEPAMANMRGEHYDVTRSLILALGVCYHACLKTREGYRNYIAPYFHQPCKLNNGPIQIAKEIEYCQDVFLNNVPLEKNIAKNMALKENLFMMVVCIELRIPLFLVGKPGSSKSLAKTIVSDAMQGNASRDQLFKELKQAQMVSFQCSPLSTPDGIVGTFKQCAQFQKDKDLDTFVSTVVLDEVGLAEDSPRMPLKTLHPLLEDGCQGDEKPEKYMKVAFVGISNWSLDPAKMNRGILVQREVPDLEELINSARGICSTTDLMEIVIKPMAKSYLEIFESSSKSMREFFGLRDFYSLVKMVYSFVDKSGRKPTWHEMLHAIKRNFGGLDQGDSVDSFRKHLTNVIPFDAQPRQTDPDCSASGLIQACLFDTNKMNSESRYLLLLTENYGALTIIQQEILTKGSQIRPITIFGSSFRSDQEYTQVCRNINKIKVCMETGNTVVLLNLENLYESLYDALNQYYVYFGGERYVDLGLGTHRVKCPVHRNFRLIVVAEKQTVYKKFPIPLINRLEKHFLTINTMLSPKQQTFVNQLQEWTKCFAKIRNILQANGDTQSPETSVRDVFIGYHDDTCSAVVLHVWHLNLEETKNKGNQLLLAAQEILLWCATPESVTRLKRSQLPKEEQDYFGNIYFKKQVHGCLVDYLHFQIVKEGCKQLFAQVTTHSKLLANVHKSDIARATGITQDKILLLETLSSFDTEQQFSNKIKHHLKGASKDQSLMVIQCDSGDLNANLIASARYCVMDEYEKLREELKAPIYVVFIVQLPRIRGGCFTGFQCGIWHSVHIDDLYKPDETLPKLEEMIDTSVAKLFGDAVALDVDEGIQTRPMEWKGFEVDGKVPSERQNRHYEAVNQTIDSEIVQGMESEPVHINDVELEMEAVKYGEQHREIELSEHGRTNVKGLILNCVQAALSMVKDKGNSNNRETDRVAVVLRLLHEDNSQGPCSFVHGVSKLIAKLLKEKEHKTLGMQMANQWLIDEAAKPDNITKAGTFRRACIQMLELKVSPILAGIIAYIDTNQNLNILQDQTSPWKQELWLTLINTPDAIPLKFTDLQSPTRQSDLREVLVTTTGYEGHYFGTRLPFSWIIHDLVHEIMKMSLPESEHIEEEEKQSFKINSWARLLKETPLGQILDNVPDDEAFMDYIHDFVHTVYNATSDEEHMLVSQSLLYLSNKLLDGLPECQLLQKLISMHLAHESLAPRLAYFHSMNVVWPECSGRIIALKKERPDHFMFQEQEFIFSTLCFLIENLSPDGSDYFNEQHKRTQWLNKVHRYRPVIEKVFGLCAEDPNVYGVHGVLSQTKARTLWSRVIVMKLFLEHVCASEDDKKITIRYCMPLWKILTDDVDMKNIKSLSAVEKFLKTCNKTAQKEFLGAEQKCDICECVLEGPPLVLPCKHILCDGCHNDMKALDENCCPKCKRPVGENWNPERQIENRMEIKKIRNYQRRCNVFFMDIVSQLCFADYGAPSDEVIDRLLSYITYNGTRGGIRTKDMSIFGTGLDPNPVFRSFLLQLMMRTSEDRVKQNLDRYLKTVEDFIKVGKHDQNEQLVELSLLVIQCLEDIFLQESLKTDSAEYARRILRQVSNSLKEEHLNVAKLYGLAIARTGLAITAKYISEIVTNYNRKQTSVDNKIRKLIEAAQILCQDSNIPWLRVYLVKYMCRCFGVDIYADICKGQIPFLRWISLPNMNTEQVEGPDRYIVCGDAYTQLRESITKVVLGDDTSALMKNIEELRVATGHVEPLLHLAVHREITCSYLYSQQKRKTNEQVLQKLVTFIQSCEHIKHKTSLLTMIQNQFAPAQLSMVENEPIRQQGIKCLVVHFICAMSGLQGNKTLLKPLLALISQPQTYVNTFLPTMPQDDLEDVKEALLAARKDPTYANENPFFYRCPNGHPYVIGDCGRPYVLSKCSCGADIGGQGHVLLQTNKLDAGVDQSVKGHILGRADARSHVQVSERSLTPTYCACVRLILHMALYAGTATNTQAINAMITPNINAEEVDQYLWKHILRDVEDLQRSLGRSVDDILLLMHTIVDNIMRSHAEGETVNNEITEWSTKKGRSDWEAKFSTKFLQPQLQAMDNILKTNSQGLAKDERLGANPLLCLLYETGGQTDQESPTMLQDVPRVWRFRTPISIDSLRQELETQNVTQHKGIKQHKVLQIFLKEEHNLRAIRYIPSILRLHRALIHKYQKKLDKFEASSITVAQLIKEEVAGSETASLIQDFVNAWELVRNSLVFYGCPTEAGVAIVSKEYCSKDINDKTPISMLLPTNKEAGLCSYALLDFLMRKQNDFLDKYLKENGRKSDSIASVCPKEVTVAHLISYDPVQDILPLVLANCRYSFEIGKGTKIEYDFGSLERQMMDRFMFSKSRIDVGRVLQIDLMIYRTEVTNAEALKKLAEKITQETLGNAVKTQIRNETKLLPDLCQSLDNLDIAISFLKTIGGDPQQCLYDFMSQTLKMVSSLHSAKARQECQFKHCRSLWLLLSLLKSQKMCDQNQHRQAIFESVPVEFLEDLTDEVDDSFRRYMKDLSIEKLSQLVEVLHEFILLVVSVRENPNDDNYADTKNHMLKDWLPEYINEMDVPSMDVAIMRDFPAEILYKHSVHAWIMAQEMLRDKQTGNTGRRY